MDIGKRIDGMKAIKGYLAFTSYIYRIVMFGVLPLALIALYVLGTVVMGNAALIMIFIIPLDRKSVV